MSADDNQAGGDLPSPPWQLWVDGTALPNPGRMSIGLVLAPPAPFVAEARLTGLALGRQGCNNEAELRALIAGLNQAREAAVQCLLVRSDSDFVVRHVRGEMVTRVARLMPLIAEAQQCLQHFRQWELLWIPRHRNGQADKLAREALGLKPKAASPRLK